MQLCFPIAMKAVEILRKKRDKLLDKLNQRKMGNIFREIHYLNFYFMSF